MRLIQIHVSNYLIDECFRQDSVHNAIKISKGLPKDARLRDAKMVDFGRAVALTFQHDSFDEVPEGAAIPVMDCEVQQIPPASKAIDDMTDGQRQSLYIRLHDWYDCRRYK